MSPYLSREIADSATILEDMVKDSANITDCSGKYSGLKQKVRISTRPEELAVIFIYKKMKAFIVEFGKRCYFLGGYFKILGQ